jgi:hypothetical protein
MKRKTKQKQPVLLIADWLPPKAGIMTPRVTDMRNGLFRPEVLLRNDIYFGRCVFSAGEAHRRAVVACEKGVRAAVEALSAA